MAEANFEIVILLSLGWMSSSFSASGGFTPRYLPVTFKAAESSIENRNEE